MKKWEYAIIKIDDSSVEKKMLTAIFLEDYLLKAINDMGKEGWEIVCLLPRNYNKIIFKRPLEEEIDISE